MAPTPRDNKQKRLDAKRTAKLERQRLEDERRAQEQRERRRLMLVTGAIVAVGVILVGTVFTVRYIREADLPENQPVSAFGVAPAEADCGPVEEVEPEPAPDGVELNEGEDGDRLHVGPQSTEQLSDITEVEYQNNPPASGPHFIFPMPREQAFYTPDSTQVPNLVERTVHNLEHGYTVVWYDDTVAGDSEALQDLRDLTTNLRDKGKKFMVVPWPDDRPDMADGKHVAVTAWHAQQLCGGVSGEAIAQFVDEHPPSRAPEPDGL